MIERSTLAFPDAPGGGFDVDGDAAPHRVHRDRHRATAWSTDWRHGMYQGPLVVQGLDEAVDEIAAFGQYGVVDHVARFETSDGAVGYGLHEHGFFGPFAKYGMHDAYSGAS